MRNIFQLIVFLSLIIGINEALLAQNTQKLRVYFTNKEGSTFNPYEYFDQKAIENRIKQGLPLYDLTDYPVSEMYINEVETIADSLGFSSRWFNFTTAWISSEEQIKLLNSLSFVSKTEHISDKLSIHYAFTEEDEPKNNTTNSLMERQLRRMGGQHFQEKGINGKGIRIAVFDGGFPDVDKHEAFAHIRDEGRIIATYDFIKKRENVYYGNSHGRATLACIAGIWKGQAMGLATAAEFLLAKTEIGLEPYSEEENWLAAAEWADKNGANIISSSLGYGYHRYFTSDMDGKSSLVVKAAQMAARKGILVVNSAGNEANSSWETIITPADGDSVLAIGGISPSSDYHIHFSSLGPTADRRLKPNVSAYGEVMSVSKTDLKKASGTSFSCPLVSGFAACVWELNPHFNNMELFRKIEESGHLFPYYDYAHGYGVPQASFFTNKDSIGTKITFTFIEKDDKIIVEINPENFNNTEWLFNSNHLYYHYSDADGYLTEYNVIYVMEKQALVLKKSAGQILRVSFRSYTDEIKMQ